MKKLLFITLFLFSAVSAHAGSSSCTNSSSYSWYQAQTESVPGPYYTFSPSDCVVNVSQADAGSETQNVALLATLPAGASDGDKFTLNDTSSYSVDVCTTWYSDPDPEIGGDGNTYTGCQPGGIGFNAADSANVGSEYYGYAQGVNESEFYFTACKGPTLDPCTTEQLPYYWDWYPKQRYKLTATFNGSTGEWDVTKDAAN